MPNKLWQKDYPLDQRIADFTVGRDRELDLELAPFDILGSIAHVTMLEEVGLIDRPAARRCNALTCGSCMRWPGREQFVIEAGVEDVHSQVELLADPGPGRRWQEDSLRSQPQ